MEECLSSSTVYYSVFCMIGTNYSVEQVSPERPTIGVQGPVNSPTDLHRKFKMLMIKEWQKTFESYPAGENYKSSPLQSTITHISFLSAFQESPALQTDKDSKLLFHPAERNKGPILETLQKYIDSSLSGSLLEISSGSGQHVAHIAPNYPNLIFQPTEYDEKFCNSIAKYINDNQLTNVLQPLRLDVSQPVELWADGSILPDSYEYVLNVNLLHVCPWVCSEGLFRGSSVVLKNSGLLFTYGPFAVNGVIIPESNIEFDRMIRAQNPSWGLRDIEINLKPLASNVGIELIHQHDLPANNKLLVWKKVRQV